MTQQLLDDLLAKLQQLTQQTKECLQAPAPELQNVQDYLDNPPEAVAKIPPCIPRFFAERRLLLQECFICKEQPKYSTEEYNIAKKIWQNFNSLSPFCLQYCHNQGKTFDYPVDSQETPSKIAIRSLCQHLKKNGFIDYKEEEACLHLTVPKDNHQRQLLHGGWGECVVLYLLRKALVNAKIPHCKYQFFTNLKLREIGDANKTSMELDVALLINKKILFIFESKCGQTLRIDKWVDRTRLFEAPPIFPDVASEVTCHFITCTPHDEIVKDYFAPYHLMHFSTLEEDFIELLKTVLEADTSATPLVSPATSKNRLDNVS